MSSNMINDIKDFIEKFGFDKDKMDINKLLFRQSLSDEEYNETFSALGQRDAEEYVDGQIDQIVILIGNLLLQGVDVEKAWNEVHRANMTKQRGVKPGREGSGGFDVVKPPGWKGPDHSDNHGVLDSLFNNEDN